MIEQIVRGALGGLVATVPMSAAMEVGVDQLPKHEQYPLPPRLITQRLTRAVGIDHRLNRDETKALTLAAHFGYGAAMGAIYGALTPERYVGPKSGIAFGLGVWTASYLGVLPMLGILAPATKHPARRTALMIAAHVVWGSALGASLKAMDSNTEEAKG